MESYCTDGLYHYLQSGYHVFLVETQCWFTLFDTRGSPLKKCICRIYSKSARHASVDQLLEKLSLGARRHHRPSELSGGEMQRVAIARALYNQPKLLLADEPTGNLDLATAQSILGLFQQLNGEGLTIIVVTHNRELAGAARRQIVLSDGRVISDLAGSKGVD
jgi:putative ABC transport system ATP-binding protein